ncbi:hypothetical protein VCHA43O270_20492 [Vibrio chagasii]|nr:hypothetical protein VCHA43O270_20492 [Vibrio chagasii]
MYYFITLLLYYFITLLLYYFITLLLIIDNSQCAKGKGRTSYDSNRH